MSGFLLILSPCQTRKKEKMQVNLLYHQSKILLDDEFCMIEKAKLDKRNFAPLYEKYHSAIFRYIVKRVDEKEMAYDITSIVFMKALTNLQKFEFRGVPFSSWLFRIAKSELYQSFRDTKARRTVNIDTIFSAQIMEEFVEDYTDEQRTQLMSALHLLKPNQLQLIEMRYFEKQSFREIGNFLGITENNAKVKTFRTLLKLKTVFLNIKK